MRRKYNWTAEQDEQLRLAYDAGHFKTGILKRLAQQWGVADWVPSYRAQQLGFSRVRESSGRHWSQAELAILDRNQHLTSRVLSLRLRKAGFPRSTTAVRIKRLQQRCRERRGYSASELSELMGVTPGTICKWIQRGLLKAKRRTDHNAGGPNGGEHPWLIRSRAVKQFIVENTSAVHLGRCDKHWLVDLLTNKQADSDGATV